MWLPSNSTATGVGLDAVAVEQLVVLLADYLKPMPPPGYSGRYWTVTVAAGIALVQCLIYLVSSLCIARATNQGKFGIMHVHHTSSGGRMIALNGGGIFMYVVCMTLYTTFVIITRWRLYILFWGEIDTKNYTMQQWAVNTSLLFIAWVYCYNTVTSMMRVPRHGYKGPSRRLVWACNGFFAAWPIVWLAVTAPLSVLVEQKSTATMRAAIAALNSLRNLQYMYANGAPQEIVGIGTTTAYLSVLFLDTVTDRSRGFVIAINVLTCFFFVASGVIAIASLSAIRVVLAQSRWNSRMLSTSASISANNNPSQTTDLEGEWQRRFAHKAEEIEARAHAANTLLRKLAYDLACSAPLALVIAAYICIVSSTSAAQSHEIQRWPWRELAYDGTSWCCILLIPGLALWQYNLVHYYRNYKLHSRTSMSGLSGQPRESMTARGDAGVVVLDLTHACTEDRQEAFNKGAQQDVAPYLGQGLTYSVDRLVQIDDPKEGSQTESIESKDSSDLLQVAAGK